MPFLETDIVIYGSAVMAEDDTTLNVGGAIDLTTRVVFTSLDANSQIEVLSGNAADTTQTLTVVGRNPAGELITEVKALNGTTPVTFNTTFKRLLKATLDGTAVGVVTVRKIAAAGDLMVFEPGLLEIRRCFYLAASDVDGGAARDYYEKIFVKNTNPTTALSAAKISLPVNPSNRLSFKLENVLNGTDSNGAGNNRLVSPGGVFDVTEKDVANNGNFTNGGAQGVWLKMTLPAGTAAAAFVPEIRTSGQEAA